MMFLVCIKGTFNGKEGLELKSSVQLIMYRIIGYILLKLPGILLST